MAEKTISTRNRAQDKDDKDEDKETNALLKEMKVIQMKMDHIEKQLNSKVDGLYSSLEKILKGELKKCVKEIQENIDLEISALKSHPERLQSRGSGPGVVRAEFASVREKVDILRGKHNLKSNTQFAKVFVRSAKSHTDRIMESNFKTLLRDLPTGKDQEWEAH